MSYLPTRTAHLSACLLASVLAGCVARVSPSTTPAEFASRVTIERSDFSKEVTYASTTIRGTATLFFLRSFYHRDTGELGLHQLYVSRFYYRSQWLFLDSAADDSGAARPVILIKRQAHECMALAACSFTETLGVTLPDDFLRSRADRGFRVQVSAQNGEGAFVVEVPSNYLQGHLAALPR